jgi:hypothetical protein
MTKSQQYTDPNSLDQNRIREADTLIDLILFCFEKWFESQEEGMWKIAQFEVIS